MKVICINDNWNRHPDLMDDQVPFVGEECEIIDSTIFRNNLYYVLSGRFHKDSGFIADHFALQSEIDEVEIWRQRLGELDYKYEY